MTFTIAKLYRGFQILLATLISLILVVTVLSLVSFDSSPLMARVIPLQNPGGSHHSLARFRDAKLSGPVDVVFMGSSHAYRGFDSRRFESIGLKSCNLGSSSQTPMNSLAVMERHLKHLRPRLVLYALNQPALSIDGMESFYDLLSNTPLDWPIIKMAWRTQHPQAWPAVISTLVRNINVPFEDQKQQASSIRAESYIQGGYMECKQEFPEDRFKNLINYPYGQWSYAISPAQIQYFRECLKVSEESEAVLVACSCPIPLETRRIITDYEKNQKEITSLMRTMGVKYVDFNDSLVLETKTHYFDELHLNQQGVEKFNDALILWLQQEKLL